MCVAECPWPLGSWSRLSRVVKALTGCGWKFYIDFNICRARVTADGSTIPSTRMGQNENVE